MNVKSVSRMVILVGLLSTRSLLAVGPTRPEAATVETTDVKGVTTMIGYIYTHLLDYEGDEMIAGYEITVGSVPSGYGSESIDFGDVNGGMHGILAGQRFSSGFGWSLQAAYGSNISLDGDVSFYTYLHEPSWTYGTWTSPLDIEMSRLDLEGLVILPVPKWMSFVLGGWDVGVKYALVEKTWKERRPTGPGWEWGGNIPLAVTAEHTNSWLGPMIGAFGNVPLIRRDSPVSFFWSANLMYMYVQLDADEPFEDLEGDEWLLGGNVTAGFSFDIANRVRMSAGYRIQILGEDLPHDQYQGIIGSAAVLF